MNIKQLKLFKAFVEYKNVNTVAEVMNLSQPTVSFHLKKLQDSYKMPLYIKKTDELKLTPAGEMLYLHATQIIALVDETERMLSEYSLNKIGTISLGTSNTPLKSILPDIFKDFLKSFPHIKLEIHVDNVNNIIQRIKNRDLDIGIISEMGILDDELIVKRIKKNPLVYVMDESHPLMGAEKLKVSDVKDYPFIIHQSGSTRKSIDEWRAKFLVDINISMEINSLSCILSMIKNSEYVSILSETAVCNEPGIITKKIQALPQQRYLSLVYKKDKNINAITQDFISSVFKNEMIVR